MAVTELPTSTVLANYQFETELDGVEFRLSFKYNSRDEAWYMTVLDNEDTVLRAGIKVVNGWALLKRWVALVRPAGEIIAINQGTVDGPATLNQLGAEVLLTYLDASEIVALG